MFLQGVLQISHFKIGGNLDNAVFWTLNIKIIILLTFKVHFFHSFFIMAHSKRVSVLDSAVKNLAYLKEPTWSYQI